jgi:hypothetical protein
MIKRVILLIAIVLMLIPGSVVMASDVTDADYSGVIRVSNNGTDAQNVAVPVTGCNSTNLISGGFLAANASDCTIARAGSDIPFMPGYGLNPWCLWVSDIATSTYFSDTLYTPNVTGGLIRYFPGAAGMTVADDATIELGNNFTITATNIYLNTANGTDKIILRKPGAISVYISDTVSGNISASNGYPHAIAGYPQINSNSSGVGANTVVPVSQPADLESDDLFIILIDLYDVAGVVNPAITTPVGYTQLFHTAYSTNKRLAAYYRICDGTETDPINFTIDRNSYYSYKSLLIDKLTYGGVPVCGVTSSGASSSPDSPSLNTGSDYPQTWLSVAGSIHQPTAAPADYSGLMTSLQNSACASIATREYTGTTQDPGAFTCAATTWAANTISISTPIIVTLTGITSVEYDVTVSENTTHLILSIDGTSNSAALNGASVPDNGNDYYLFENDSAMYAGKTTVNIAGVDVSAWEWEYGAIFPDSIGANDATPSFRTVSSDADVSAELIEFSPIAEATAPAYSVADAEPFLTTTPTITSDFTTNTTGSTLPGSDVISATATAGGTPVSLPFTILGCFGLLAISFTASYLTKKSGSASIWPKMLCVCIAAGLLVGVKVFDFWMITYLLMMIAAFSMAKTHSTWGGEAGYNVVGFLAMSFVGMTIINRVMEGVFINSTDVGILNNVLVFRPINVFGLFQISVPNLDFLSTGIPHLMRWDYSFFGGNAVIIQYMFYSITAFVAFLLFVLMLGVVFNMLSRNR